jgi:hypothetical protein
MVKLAQAKGMLGTPKAPVGLGAAMGANPKMSSGLGMFGAKLAGRMGMKKGGSVSSSASKRGDGCAIRGKTKGKMV